MNDHASIINALRQGIDRVLTPYASHAKKLILLDFPNHGNVGDSAIYVGEIEFFKQNFRKCPVIVSDWTFMQWKTVDRIPSENPIFLHGGGNFGDMWANHQTFREEVLKRYPERLVVQLPQSIHYADRSLIERTARSIAAHGNFVLLVRDETSYRLAKAHFPCVVHKCPDMAFYLGAVKRPVEPAHRLLLLMRTDREANASMRADPVPLPSSAVREDWLLEPATTRRDAKRNAAAAALFSLSFSKMGLTERYYDCLARARVRRGMRQLASAEFVITDRLHVHILSLLMDLPHIVLDNSYGKIARFMDLWTKDYDQVRRAHSLSAAVQLWKSSATQAYRR